MLKKELERKNAELEAAIYERNSALREFKAKTEELEGDLKDEQDKNHTAKEESCYLQGQNHILKLVVLKDPKMAALVAEGAGQLELERGY